MRLNDVILCRIDGSAIEEKEGSYMDMGVRGPRGGVVDGKKRRGGRGDRWESARSTRGSHGMVSEQDRCDSF